MVLGLIRTLSMVGSGAAGRVYDQAGEVSTGPTFAPARVTFTATV